MAPAVHAACLDRYISEAGIADASGFRTGFALMAIARESGQPFKLAGLFVLGAAIGLSLLPPGAGRGILQRGAELCLFGALALAAWRL